jgi:hypothetical protein
MNLANCAAFNLPVTNFNDCDPDVNYSEIERVFAGSPQGTPFANILDANEWGTRMSQTTVNAQAIRGLIVIGDMPAAATVVKDLSNGRKKTIGKDFTVNFDIDDISDENYLLVKTLEDNQTIRLYGFETQGGKLYHYGPGGILATVAANVVLARGRDEIERISGTITWRNKNSPNRVDSPIFDNGDIVTPTTFDSQLVTATDATPGPIAGVAATATGTDAEQSFEFNAITPQVGTPATMNIKVATALELVIDYPSDYIGSPFRYTDLAGAVHTGNFVNGDVNF